LARFFTAEGGTYKVTKALRAVCIFSTHNLLSDPPFARMDLIVSRNLLIYVDAALQQLLMPVLHYALVAQGYLFLGASEGVTTHDGLFRTVDKQHRIFQRNDRVARPRVDVPFAAPMRRPARRAGMPLVAVPADAELGPTVDRILLGHYAPPAVVITEQLQIVYFSGRTGAYLEPPAGAPSRDILAMAGDDLRLALQIAIRTALRDQAQFVHADLVVTTRAGTQRLNLIVRPLTELHSAAGMLLVIFQELGLALSAVDADALGVRVLPADEVVQQLAQELQTTRDALETTISALQETNVDLQSANEELQSANEELQSANEELQSANEEIQSINEEYQTVNAELHRNVEELDRANADLDNLFASTEIPALFLHQDGRIARFTPAAREVFRLIATDVGRPIDDIVPYFRNGDLAPLIRDVLLSLTPFEEQVHNPADESWWIMRLRPYHTRSKAVDGIVMTFVDITMLKRVEAEREHTATLLQHAYDVLEERVQVRTRDLAAANLALQVEISERKQSEQSRQLLLQQLVTGQEEERRRIARELHDQMGQDLTALMLRLKALHDTLPHDAAAHEDVAQLQALTVKIGQEVRRLAVQLRPAALDGLGLAVALTNYVEEWSAHARVAADFHTSGLEDERLPLAVETTLYRIAQEALTNVLKHAQATGVSLIIERRANAVRMIVEDNGVGFAVARAQRSTASERRLGLIGMHERVAQLGGVLTIEATPGSGTTVFVDIPLADAKQGGADGTDTRVSGR
ncbi:MAG: PAS domain-containing protein, partial [Chloroflexales bacterium]|nr:PAS domain-containing protein [Chloroflexales bacterium]